MKKILLMLPLSMLLIFEVVAQRTPSGVTKQALTDSVAKRPALSTTGNFYPAYNGTTWQVPSLQVPTEASATLTTKIQSGLVPTGALTDSVVMYNPITKTYSRYLASDLAGTSVTSTGFVNLANQVFATNVYANSTNGTFAIPSAGKWLLKYNIQTDGTGVTVANPMFAITDAAGTVIVGSERARAGASTVGQGLSAEVEVTTTGAENYFLKGRAGAASGSATILSSSAAGQSTINWIQVGTTAVTSFANLVPIDANGNTVQVDITKNVGIGTATPTSKLHVVGNIQLGTNINASTASPLLINSGGTYGNGAAGSSLNLKWKMYDNGTAIGAYGIGMSSGIMEFRAGANGGFGFYPNDGVLAMRILPSGNVGIGTTTPTSKFQVNGSQAGTFLNIAAATTLGEQTHIWAAGAITYLVTLPAASTCTGRVYVITNTQVAKTISSYTTLANVASTALPLNTTLTLVSTGAVWKQF